MGVMISATNDNRIKSQVMVDAKLLPDQAFHFLIVIFKYRQKGTRFFHLTNKTVFQGFCGYRFIRFRQSPFWV